MLQIFPSADGFADGFEIEPTASPVMQSDNRPIHVNRETIDDENNGQQQSVESVLNQQLQTEIELRVFLESAIDLVVGHCMGPQMTDGEATDVETETLVEPSALANIVGLLKRVAAADHVSVLRSSTMSDDSSGVTTIESSCAALPLDQAGLKRLIGFATIKGRSIAPVSLSQEALIVPIFGNAMQSTGPARSYWLVGIGQRKNPLCQTFVARSLSQQGRLFRMAADVIARHIPPIC